MEILMRHDFPGNVRELENVIEYGFVLCHSRLIDVPHLPEDLQQASQRAFATKQPDNGLQLRLAEADVIRFAIKHNGGHLGKTVQELGISRATLWRKMKKYSISTHE
jgi:DNA-binding NtrC family response regulator